VGLDVFQLSGSHRGGVIAFVFCIVTSCKFIGVIIVSKEDNASIFRAYLYWNTSPPA
jgi:hypothetical protein